MTAAALLAAALLLAVLAVPKLLAHAAWPSGAPAHALLLWQALGLAGGLLALELLLTVALIPYGSTHLGAVRALVTGEAAPARWWSVLAGVLWLLLLARLLSVLLRSTASTLRSRRRHRQLVDLVATRNPLLPGARVVDHDVPIAYCLPGLRSRVVLSRGVVQALREDELHAVLAHEAAHVEQRHDLVVLPFIAIGATFPRLAAVRTAQAHVAMLIEMLADDRACRTHSAAVLARALDKVAAARVPAGGLAVSGPSSTPDPHLVRSARLTTGRAPFPLVQRTAVLAAVVLTLLLPVLPLAVASG